jgi:hypothetical protein
MQGDDYQARWFWRNVCRLFDPNTKVIKVCYEANNVKSFDDIVVHYGPGMKDESGNDLLKDFYQVKFHVTSAGAFSGETMMDPAFINATTFSILQRLRDAQPLHAPRGTGARFIIHSPWIVDPNDVLAQIHSQTDGELLLEKLFTSTPNSKLGKLRNSWQRHLGLQSDSALREILMPLRIRVGLQLHPSLEDLSNHLAAAGFVPPEAGRSGNPYDDLVKKWLQSRKRCEFTKTEIQQICHEEGLWRGRSLIKANAHRLAVRSFSRGTENLAAENDASLCLLHCFNERKVKDPNSWDTEIISRLESFLKQELKAKDVCYIHLHVHSSIAFAAGYLTDSKIGVQVVPVQSSVNGKEVWYPTTESLGISSPYPVITESEEVVSSAGKDLAICLSITRDIGPDVRHYCLNSLASVRRIVSFQAGISTDAYAIKSGHHARHIAEHVANYLKTNRSLDERSGILHIFSAAPNGLMFFLGQLARGFGKTCTYEYDFELNAPGAYSPALTLPSKTNKA